LRKHVLIETNQAQHNIKSPQAYLDLVKAVWIVVDIVESHGHMTERARDMLADLWKVRVLNT